MKAQERKRMIASYGRAPRQLAAALKRFPRRMWKYKPGPERWSIHEILVHLADSEANSYVRCRRCIAEPGHGVMAYDQERWASALRYHDQDPDAAAELFGLLRRMSHRLVSPLPESAWSSTIDHPENGIMTLDDWLGVYARHVPDHIRQMEATHEAWRSRAKRGPAGRSVSLFRPSS